MCRTKLVLADMDGFVARFEEGVTEILTVEYPWVTIPRFEDRRTFYLDEELGPWGFLVAEIVRRKGFFLSLKPNIAALAMIEAIDRMENVEVKICTSPLQDYRYCVREKYEWVERYMGPKMVQRVIMIRDKTDVFGEYLLDDKPHITGSNQTPIWEHVVVDQPYNRSVTNRRISLDNYQGWKWLYEELKYE